MIKALTISSSHDTKYKIRCFYALQKAPILQDPMIFMYPPVKSGVLIYVPATRFLEKFGLLKKENVILHYLKWTILILMRQKMRKTKCYLKTLPPYLRMNVLKWNAVMAAPKI